MCSWGEGCAEGCNVFCADLRGPQDRGTICEGHRAGGGGREIHYLDDGRGGRGAVICASLEGRCNGMRAGGERGSGECGHAGRTNQGRGSDLRSAIEELHRAGWSQCAVGGDGCGDGDGGAIGGRIGGGSDDGGGGCQYVLVEDMGGAGQHVVDGIAAVGCRDGVHAAAERRGGEYGDTCVDHAGSNGSSTVVKGYGAIGGNAAAAGDYHGGREGDGCSHGGWSSIRGEAGGGELVDDLGERIGGAGEVSRIAVVRGGDGVRADGER